MTFPSEHNFALFLFQLFVLLSVALTLGSFLLFPGIGQGEFYLRPTLPAHHFFSRCLRPFQTEKKAPCPEERAMTGHEGAEMLTEVVFFEFVKAIER